MKFGQKRITELAEVVSGGTPKSNISEYWDGDILWATPTDVSKNKKKFLTTTERQLTKLGLEKSSAKVLPEKSVLLTSRAPIGLVAINEEAMSTNQGFKNLIPKASTSPDYLYWWLKCNTKKLQFMGTGATFKELSKATIERLTLPCPPLAEQKRIAGILDAAEELREKRQRSLELLDELKQSIFIDMFGEEITASSNSVGSIVEDFQTGKSLAPSSVDTPELNRVLKVSAVTSGKFKAKESKPLPTTYLPAENHFVQSGDLLFSRANTSELIGATALVKECANNIVLSDKLWRFKFKSAKKAYSTYIQYAFWRPEFRREIVQRASGTSGSMKNISKPKVLSIPLKIPCLEKAVLFSDKISALELHEVRLRSSSQQIDELFTSLQHKAFAGELSGTAA